MAIDASIYQNLDTRGLMQGLAGIGEAYAQGVESKNRLAQLAQQQELQALQIQKAKQEAELYPSQLAEQKRKFEQKHIQEMSFDISNALQQGMDKQQLMDSTYQEAKRRGISDEGIAQLYTPLSQNTGDAKAAQYYLGTANPEEAQKQQLKSLYERKSAESDLSKIDQKDFTPESFKAYLQTKDRSVLMPIDKTKVDKGMTQAQQLDFEEKLSSKHAGQSANFIAGRDAYTQLKSTLSGANNSPASTLAAATKFMKMIDPGSVVRESELGMALQAQGVYDRMANYFHALEIGKNLTPEQVKDFEATAKKIYDASAEGQKQLDDEYRKQAKQWGVNPDHVVRDYHYKELKPKTPANAVPVKIANDAEYNALPAGSSYIAPDGSVRRKK